MEKKIVTTDEKIARFTSVCVLGALDVICGYKLAKSDFILMKDAFKKDMNLETCYNIFKEMVSILTDKN